MYSEETVIYTQTARGKPPFSYSHIDARYGAFLEGCGPYRSNNLRYIIDRALFHVPLYESKPVYEDQEMIHAC
jgi:hypothetical protein